ncbi:uncharacterized protein L201_007493 [Kwoniella dendrophila CBS 6074]|uniref:U3 small nucleolar RNA-associated protein 4 n=1 Tax=Kwoniella dendrophila CBS 6074 TaxID=1295534 RepID=A0AAX4K548_9TREE
MPNVPASVPLHRIRFYDHTPSPITALQFAPLPLPPPRNPSSLKGKSKDASHYQQQQQQIKNGGKEEFGVLILARENGEVEIWEYARGDDFNMSGNWVLEKTLPPTLTHPTISTIALVIRDPSNFHKKSYAVPRVEDLRLFTAGSDSNELIERCLITGKILQTYDIPSPPLWTLSVSPTHDLLCLSTGSQSLHFLSIPSATIFNKSPRLEPPPSHLLRCDTLPSRTRTVSIAWGIPKLVKVSSSSEVPSKKDEDGDEEGDDEEEEWEWRNTYLITGNSDSSFRKWELPAPLDPSKPALNNRVLLKSRAVLEKLAKPGRGGKKASSGNSNKGTIVWGVGVLPDHNFVTSDSLGNVTFWDGQSMAQQQNFRAHKADGMCLTIGPGGRSVFTSGPDQRVCQFMNVSSTTSGSGSSSSSWVLTSSKRVHSHDVRALSIFPGYIPLSKTNQSLLLPLINPDYSPILASGGWDMSLSLTSAGLPDLLSEKLKNPLSKPNTKKTGSSSSSQQRSIFEESFSRKYGYLSGGKSNSSSSSRISFAPKARLFLGRKDKGLGIWKVLKDEQGWEKVLEMELRLRTNLISSAISPNGKWLAVSDLYETKLFQLHTEATAIRPIRVKSFLSTLISSPSLENLSIPSKGCGSSSIIFTPDSQRLILGLVSSGQLLVLELPEQASEEVDIVKCFTRREDKIVDGRVVKGKSQSNGTSKDLPNGDSDINMSENGENEEDGREDEDDDDESEDEILNQKEEDNQSWISCLGVSDDNQWLAASDLDGRTGIWNLDTLQIHATLPTLPHSPISLNFPPCSTPLLLLALPTNILQFYHLENRKLLSSAITSNQLNELHTALSSLHTPLHGIIFSSSSESLTSKSGNNIHHNNKTVKTLIWGTDWLVTSKLNLDDIIVKSSTNKNRRLSESPSVQGTPTKSSTFTESGGVLLSNRQLKKKRAREAKEQRDQLDSLVASSSSLINGVVGVGGIEEKEEKAKVIRDRFKNILSIGWLSNEQEGDNDEHEEEIAVIERPLNDFSGELPNAFWSGGFGRS